MIEVVVERGICRRGTAARFYTARYTPDKWPTSCVVTQFFMTSDFPEPSEPKKGYLKNNIRGMYINILCIIIYTLKKK